MEAFSFPTVAFLNQNKQKGWTYKSHKWIYNSKGVVVLHCRGYSLARCAAGNSYNVKNVDNRN